jgi:hypothetical protein
LTCEKREAVQEAQEEHLQQYTDTMEKIASN